MVCAIAFPAVSACKKWDDSCSARGRSSGDVWIHSRHVVPDNVTTPLVLLDFRCDYLGRHASHAGVFRASHFAPAPRGPYRRFDSFLCADGSSILFVDSMKPWPNAYYARVVKRQKGIVTESFEFRLANPQDGDPLNFNWQLEGTSG